MNVFDFIVVLVCEVVIDYFTIVSDNMLYLEKEGSLSNLNFYLIWLFENMILNSIFISDSSNITHPYAVPSNSPSKWFKIAFPISYFLVLRSLMGMQYFSPIPLSLLHFTLEQLPKITILNLSNLYQEMVPNFRYS